MTELNEIFQNPIEIVHNNIKFVKKGTSDYDFGNVDVEHLHMEITIFGEKGILSLYYEESEDDLLFDACCDNLHKVFENIGIDITEFCDQLVYDYGLIENIEEYILACK